MRVANIIPIDDADVLFGCVRPLLLAHQQIVIDLEIARLNLDAFFRVGVRLVDLLPLYSDYTGMEVIESGDDHAHTPSSKLLESFGRLLATRD